MMRVLCARSLAFYAGCAAARLRMGGINVDGGQFFCECTMNGHSSWAFRAGVQYPNSAPGQQDACMAALETCFQTFQAAMEVSENVPRVMCGWAKEAGAGLQRDVDCFQVQKERSYQQIQEQYRQKNESVCFDTVLKLIYSAPRLRDIAVTKPEQYRRTVQFIESFGVVNALRTALVSYAWILAQVEQPGRSMDPGLINSSEHAIKLRAVTEAARLDPAQVAVLICSVKLMIQFEWPQPVNPSLMTQLAGVSFVNEWFRHVFAHPDFAVERLTHIGLGRLRENEQRQVLLATDQRYLLQGIKQWKASKLAPKSRNVLHHDHDPNRYNNLMEYLNEALVIAGFPPGSAGYQQAVPRVVAPVHNPVINAPVHSPRMAPMYPLPEPGGFQLAPNANPYFPPQGSTGPGMQMHVLQPRQQAQPWPGPIPPIAPFPDMNAPVPIPPQWPMQQFLPAPRPVVADHRPNEAPMHQWVAPPAPAFQPYPLALQAPEGQRAMVPNAGIAKAPNAHGRELNMGPRIVVPQSVDDYDIWSKACVVGPGAHVPQNRHLRQNGNVQLGVQLNAGPGVRGSPAPIRCNVAQQAPFGPQQSVRVAPDLQNGAHAPASSPKYRKVYLDGDSDSEPDEPDDAEDGSQNPRYFVENPDNVAGMEQRMDAQSPTAVQVNIINPPSGVCGPSSVRQVNIVRDGNHVEVNQVGGDGTFENHAVDKTAGVVVDAVERHYKNNTPHGEEALAKRAPMVLPPRALSGGER